MSITNFSFTMRDLLDAGVHFGHRKNFWNPKMAKFIYGTRNGIHIIDLQQTVPLLQVALNKLKEVASQNGKILFVGTKKQAAEVIAQSAERCGQYYVNYRWLGGMLTNWDTVSKSIKTLNKYEELLVNPDVNLTKKERLDIDRKRVKLNNVLGGIRNMGGKPDVLFVIDIHQEKLAVQEANVLGIPVIAIVDTNANPEGIDCIIPGNDDARKAIELYIKLASDAILSGIQDSLASSGVDIGSVDMADFEVANIDMNIPTFEEQEKQTNEKTKVVKVVSKKKIEVATTKKEPVVKVKDTSLKASVKKDEVSTIKLKAKKSPVKAKATTKTKAE